MIANTSLGAFSAPARQAAPSSAASAASARPLDAVQASRASTAGGSGTDPLRPTPAQSGNRPRGGLLNIHA